ncbi:MAG TPA: hypothetical protein VGH28_11495 [Polyangiaceae bacterium]|jgi:hypothetical protein
MIFRTKLSIASIIFASLLAACSDSPDATDAGDDAGPSDEAAAPDAGSDVDNGAPSTTYPAFTIDAPQVRNLGKGPVFATPRVVPIFFQSDDAGFTAQLTTFLNAMAASTFWGPQVSEYGVGKLTIAAPVTLAQTPPAALASSDIRAWVATELASDASFPQPDASTIYAIFYPSGTTVTSNNGTSCVDFWAFHSEASFQNQLVSYAVAPRCAKFPQGFYGASLTGVDAVSAPISHEIIEASTDPFGPTEIAWASPDDAHAYWPLLAGGPEVTDYCYPFEASYYAPSDVGHSVARSWSNAAAAAGHDPCVPADAIPYFNAMPVMPDDVTVTSPTAKGTAKGLRLPVGTSKTIDLDLFSDAPTSGPWTVSVDPFSASLALTLDRTKGQNGEKLHLTVTAKTKSPDGWDGILIESSLAGRNNYWLAYVTNQ